MVHSSYRLLLTRHVKDIKLLSISHRGDRSFCCSRQSSGNLMICVIMDVVDEDRNNNGSKKRYLVLHQVLLRPPQI